MLEHGGAFPQLLNWIYSGNILLSDYLCIVDVFLHPKVFIYAGRNAHHALTLIVTLPHGLVSIT